MTTDDKEYKEMVAHSVRFFEGGPRIVHDHGDWEQDYYECLECGTTLTNLDVETHWCNDKVESWSLDP